MRPGRRHSSSAATAIAPAGSPGEFTAAGRPTASRPAAHSARQQYLWEALRTLWPPPARVSRHGRLARGPVGSAEFIIFPNQRHAALLVPRTPRRAAAGALRNYKASASPRDKIRFGALALAARTGIAEALPDRVAVAPGSAGPAADILGYVRATVRPDAVVSIYLGSPRANRKPVIQVLVPDGTVVAFGKVGVNPLTRDLIRAEAAALAFLGSAPLTRLRAPRLLHHGQWREHEILLQQPFPVSRPASGLAEVSGAMVELASVRGVRSVTVDTSPYWNRLRGRLEAATRCDLADPVLRALDQITPAAAKARVGFGSWHGDWTPWNMTMAGGLALVWDWERFETGVPVGYDALHYWLQGAIIRTGTDASAASADVMARAANLLRPFGVDPDAAELVAALYLTEIAARYLRDEQAEAGARLGQIDTWLLPTLTLHARRLGDAARR